MIDRMMARIRYFLSPPIYAKMTGMHRWADEKQATRTRKNVDNNIMIHFNAVAVRDWKGVPSIRLTNSEFLKTKFGAYPWYKK